MDKTSLDHAGVDRQTYEKPNCGTTTPHDQHFHSPIGGLTLNCPGAADAGRDLILELLDLYVTNAEQHIAFHEAHGLDHFAENFRVRLAVATETRDRVLAGESL